MNSGKALAWPVGTEFEVDIESIANGGHCVARRNGRVLFVRHALPNERVIARITADNGGSFCRADAVTVLRPSSDRVAPPCTYARPAGCGGCDFQHVQPARQRQLKADVLIEQLTRVAGVTPDEVARLSIQVEELPGGGVGWRDRVRLVADQQGRLGMRGHRSHNVVPVETCLIAAGEVNNSPLLSKRYPPGAEVTFATDGANITVLEQRNSRKPPRVIAGPALQRRHAVAREWRVHAGGFWQAHPGAANRLVELVLAGLAPQPGEVAFDLYCGVGLFTFPLAQAVTEEGKVLAVEADTAAVADARHNLRDQRGVRVLSGSVEQVLTRRKPASVDLVVLDPPRTGAGAKVMKQLAELHPRAIAYVSCDPATLARDLKVLASHGYRLEKLNAVDAFPMTQHVECVAICTPVNGADKKAVLSGSAPDGPGG